MFNEPRTFNQSTEAKPCFEEFDEAPKDPLSRGPQRHLRYNPETRRCNEQPFPSCQQEEDPYTVQQQDNAELDEGIFSKDYFDIRAGECKEATPVDCAKKSPKNRLSLSFRDSTSLNEFEEFAEPPVGEEIPSEPYMYSQGAPFYALREVAEDDRHYLLKMVSLAPPKRYVPSFLRETCQPDEDLYVFCCTDETPLEEDPLQDSLHEEPMLKEQCEAAAQYPTEEEVLPQEQEHESPTSIKQIFEEVTEEVQVPEDDIFVDEAVPSEDSEEQVYPEEVANLYQEPLCDLVQEEVEVPVAVTTKESSPTPAPQKTMPPYNPLAERYKQKVEQAMKFKDNQALAELLFGIKSSGLDEYFDLDVIEELAFSD